MYELKSQYTIFLRRKGDAMPRVKLTKNRIDTEIKHSDKGQVIYWDTETPGLGLVVGKKTKTFILQLDVRDADAKSGYKTIKKTLGRYGADITLEQAKEMVRGGVDRETGEAVLGERIKLRMGEPVSCGDAVILGELVTAYFKETLRSDGKARREDSAIRYKNLIEKDYFSWLDMPLKEVNALAPDTVIESFQLLSVGRPMQARNAAVMLSAVLRYGMAKYPGTLKVNPIAVLTSRHVTVMHKIQPRHECLVYDTEKRINDFEQFFKGIQQMHEIRRDLALFILYTGCRNNEGAKLEWRHVSMEHRELLISDTKNRHPLHIPLNSQTMAILTRRKEQCPEDCLYVFPAIDERRHGHVSMKAEVLAKVTGLKLTVHALRRTYITLGRKLKRYEDTDRLTNHVDSSVSGKHYDETDVHDLRETANMIGSEIERRMLAVTAKVIDISTGRKAA